MGIYSCMRVRHGGIWYSYDGMERPEDSENYFLGSVNNVIYVLTNIRKNYSFSTFQYYLIK